MAVLDMTGEAVVLPENSSTEFSSYMPIFPSPFDNTTPKPHLIAQGAESHLYRTSYLFPSQSAALKVRPSKPYRHRVLDQRLTKQRILAEARVLLKLKREGYKNVPGVYALDWTSDGARGAAWLLMEWIEGVTLKEGMLRWERACKEQNLPAGDAMAEQKARAALRRVGVAIAKLHASGVIHGDLTSSNIMMKPRTITSQQTNGDHSDVAPGIELDGEVILIDFGLAQQTVQEEDRAVDLYVLEKAFGSTHPKQEDMFDLEVLRNGYAKVDQTGFSGAKVVLKRLEDVRMRGRKRSMIG